MGGRARVFPRAGVALAGVLALGTMVVAVAYDDARPPLEGEDPTQVYERHDDCRSTPCAATLAQDGFVVSHGMREVNLVIYAALDQASGPARITVTDPSGDLRYERLFAPDASAWATQDAATWSAEIGEWTLSRSYLGTRGTLSYDAWGVGLPPAAPD